MWRMRRRFECGPNIAGAAALGLRVSMPWLLLVL